MNAVASWKPLVNLKRISVDSFGQLGVSDRLALLQQVGLLTIKDIDTTGLESRVKLGPPNDGVRRLFWTPAVFGESISNANNASFFVDLSNLVAQAAGNVSFLTSLQADISSVAQWGQSAFEAAGSAPEAARTFMETSRRF
eukprot:4979968-Amphidinium_carterae.1